MRETYKGYALTAVASGGKWLVTAVIPGDDDSLMQAEGASYDTALARVKGWIDRKVWTTGDSKLFKARDGLTFESRRRR